ncbi:MAG: DUF4159 domain-containing protein [Pseudomonadota bacterium]
MTFGPFLIGAPLALAALVLLPVIWFILRATPPAPRDIVLPSLRLLEGIEIRDETPARTPWWIVALRMAAAALAIGGLAQPVFAPNTDEDTQAGTGSLLVVIDDGWSSAQRWTEIKSAARASLEQLGPDDGVHLLLTAPRELGPNPADRFTRQEAERQIAALEPAPWPVDRAGAVDRLEAAGISPGRIFYATSAVATRDDRAAFDALSARAPLSIYPASQSPVTALTGLGSSVDGVSVTLRRTATGSSEPAFVSALSLDGTPLATAEARFPDGERETEATFTLPPAALARVNRFAVAGAQSAGLVWLWDTADRTRRVGLISTGGSAQPLLSDMHYVRKAIEPFSTLVEGDLDRVLAADPDAIIITDIGTVLPSDADALTEWMENGGALIRFAGPRLAAQGDLLVPVPLRSASRAFGGALAWDDPQAIATFPATSPFAELAAPPDARVRQQVLAQPTADLQSKTWARLEDGSPLVTAERRGAGAIILFHVTAGPDWSDLPYSGVFADMLRRSIAAGRGEAQSRAEGAYVPDIVLDGFGRLQRPSSVAAPLQGEAFAETEPSETSPPGLYRGPAGTRALNAAADIRPTAITAWPSRAILVAGDTAGIFPLAGPLLALATGLLLIDLIVALGLNGQLSRRRRTVASLALLGVSALLLFPQAPATAQSPRSAPAASTGDKALAAATEMRFGFILSGDRALDDRTRAGLRGLSRVLYLRTSVEPAEPHALNPATDPLDLYPLIYFSVPDTAQPLSEAAIANLNTYIARGGALIIDTRKGSAIGTETDVGVLTTVLEGLDVPNLMPVPNDHVITRSFYLIEGFPGRYDKRRLWIEQVGSDGRVIGDGVSRLFIGDADWAGAWAVDERARPVYAVDGGEGQRELARRFGINLVMYILTGNYKADQVHIPALLERLGNEDVNAGEPDGNDGLERVPSRILDGGPQP